ncbi:leu operon leader peptide [Photorhabdus aegyptia]|nr:leu operon leader peptide [Photorhabdus bodei]MCC8459153.1 leu operon leader peptide [Photorhabdus aegyptia]
MLLKGWIDMIHSICLLNLLLIVSDMRGMLVDRKQS